MELTEKVGSWASCFRRKVGAIIVRENRVMTTGYNGASAGITSCMQRGECLREKLNIESGTRAELCYAAHAEQNAIIQAAKYGVNIDGATLYCTHQPCGICAKMIINAGISRVVYKEGYPDEFSMQLFDEAGTKIEKYEEHKSMDNHPVVTFEMSNGKTFKAELYPEVAPNSVNNFLSLVKKGYYDGMIFHRVIPGFMIQGGDPTGTGTGGPGYHIRGEFRANGIPNSLKHERGVLSMARSQEPNSAGSQFFVMHGDAAYLDGQYAAFGKVIEGIDVVDKIAATRTDFRDKPLKEQKLKKVTAETFGIEYPEPETI